MSPAAKWRIGSIAAILYFSEGLPYGIVKELAPLYLRVEHVQLKTIGLASAVSLAWTLKFFWSPLVDAFGTYRRWIAGALVVITGSIAALALLPSNLFYFFLAVLAIGSATQDIAVDAFTIRATPNDFLGPVNSIRVTAYRVALMVGGGGLAALGGKTTWRIAFGTAAAIAFVILLITTMLPDDRGERVERKNLFGDLLHWMKRPRAGILLLIVFIYRLGEFAIVTMIKPYWVDRGYSPAEIGTITSVVGVVVSVIGVIVGGWFVSRFGLYNGLLWLGVAQVLSNLGYALVATFNAGRWSIYVAAVVENLGYGVGIAAFLAFLMGICDRDRAATEYALLSAAFGLTGTVMGAASGFIAQYAGYPVYFWLTVLLGIPVLFLLPLIRNESSLLRS
ncbi:MAG TPA: MFS transporter [Thermoanaerobaculia bacterium]|nr:MFS transporter [Thermoanaerobaculia bacterium]